MEREQQDATLDLIELGEASTDTHGGPTGYIEVTGFLPKEGISNE